MLYNMLKNIVSDMFCLGVNSYKDNGTETIKDRSLIERSNEKGND